MEHQDISRRTLLKGGAAALAGLTVLRVAGPAHAFGQSGGQVIPWLDQPGPSPNPNVTDKLSNWEALATPGDTCRQTSSLFDTTANPRGSTRPRGVSASRA